MLSSATSTSNLLLHVLLYLGFFLFESYSRPYSNSFAPAALIGPWTSPLSTVRTAYSNASLIINLKPTCCKYATGFQPQMVIMASLETLRPLQLS